MLGGSLHYRHFRFHAWLNPNYLSTISELFLFGQHFWAHGHRASRAAWDETLIRKYIRQRICRAGRQRFRKAALSGLQHAGLLAGTYLLTAELGWRYRERSLELTAEVGQIAEAAIECDFGYALGCKERIGQPLSAFLQP